VKGRGIVKIGLMVPRKEGEKRENYKEAEMEVKERRSPQKGPL